MIIKHGRHILWEIQEVCKGTGTFFLDCAFLGNDWLGRQTLIT